MNLRGDWDSSRGGDDYFCVPVNYETRVLVSSLQMRGDDEAPHSWLLANWRYGSGFRLGWWTAVHMPMLCGTPTIWPQRCLSHLSWPLLVVGDWVQGWIPILMGFVRKEGLITWPRGVKSRVQESSFQRGVFKGFKGSWFSQGPLSEVSKDSLFEMSLY